MTDTQQLIERLAGKASPVKPIGSPSRSTHQSPKGCSVKRCSMRFMKASDSARDITGPIVAITAGSLLRE